MSIRVLFFGDRNWHNLQPMIKVFDWLKRSNRSVTIIHGDCRGADKMAGELAIRFGFNVLAFPPHWKHTSQCSYKCKQPVGRAAGPIRNQKMIDDGKPVLAFGFHDSLETSKGTADMFRRLKRVNIKSYLVTSSKLPTFITKL